MEVHPQYGISWESAKNDAGQLLSRNGVERVLKGQTIDLRPFEAQIEGEVGYKIMVLRAAARLIQKRGGDVILPALPGE